MDQELTRNPNVPAGPRAPDAGAPTPTAGRPGSGSEVGAGAVEAAGALPPLDPAAVERAGKSGAPGGQDGAREGAG